MRALLPTRRWFVELFGRRLGYEQNRVFIKGEAYLDRFVLYVGGPCIRLHRFWRGDDDRAVHDHPWDFWTFPLTSYLERCPDGFHIVERFKLHFRRAEFKHYVVGCLRDDITKAYSEYWRAKNDKRPFWTIVFAKTKRRTWGHWPNEHTFINWRDWK